jgi:hydrogenase large subunit
MKGKDPRDAHFITSRICGICGDNHATCSCYAQNMAYGVRPPHLGEWVVNLGEAAEYMFDHNIFQENLVAVDFCERWSRRPIRASGRRQRRPRRRTPPITATRRSARS